ncbi:GNAT family N-acetyltransferase [Sorangium cellulosum]|uniref:Acetyltransferase n=1 Tax=Sorangium cellulosum TaxID=56 RepID=A0A150QTE7_SORCE|nr:GNAT family N-acetyltransferase [Sorangium cellulosum]KYF71254.1 acetyltransferase [Sorangium cellulosum]
MHIELRQLTAEQQGEFVHPILTAFGAMANPERLEGTKRLAELSSRIGAYDGESIVGAAGSFSLTMTTPGGGAVPVAGLTMVAVMPTHRRRGILTSLIRRHLDDARAEGRPISSLWATEGTIYGRFGYGLASRACSISIERDRAAFRGEAGAQGRARLLGEEEALEAFAPVWERARPLAPGMLARSKAWWQVRRLKDDDFVRQGGGPLQRVVIEVDGRPEAYAMYCMHHRWDTSQIPVGSVRVIEAIGASPLGTRLIWRYLFDIDLAQRIEASLLPPDHPLGLLVAEPRRLRLTASDGLWVRIVDVEAALAARAYGSSEPLTLEITDSDRPSNAGRFRLHGGERRATRTAQAPDLRLDITALGSAYLGGVSFQALADAGQVEALSEDAIERADRLFRAARAPWCPEIF